jgi:hypothetical protein
MDANWTTWKSAIVGMLGVMPQPDEVTCQSACIGILTGINDFYQIREQLEAIGVPGAPDVMGVLLRSHFGDRYTYNSNASLADALDCLTSGGACITHGWFTGSGHVIVLNGASVKGDRLLFNVIDPWSEFNAASWAYDLGSVGFGGSYSDRLIYSACVAGQGPGHAADLYHTLGKVPRDEGGMWLHSVTAG